jgi:periplasmic copper chaperone A
MKTIKTIAAIAISISATAAFPHIVLDQSTAPAGSSYRAVFKVGHGCEGLPTTGIVVQIPPGMQGAKPMPKAGWALAVRRDTLAQPYTSHGKTITEDVTEVRWTAQSADAALPEAFYDEFVLRASLPSSPGALWFKVVQTCALDGKTGSNAWTQVPAQGTSTKGMKSPAALLEVLPAPMAHDHH